MRLAIQEYKRKRILKRWKLSEWEHKWLICILYLYCATFCLFLSHEFFFSFHARLKDYRSEEEKKGLWSVRICQSPSQVWMKWRCFIMRTLKKFTTDWIAFWFNRKTKKKIIGMSQKSIIKALCGQVEANFTTRQREWNSRMIIKAFLNWPYNRRRKKSLSCACWT